MSMLSRLIRLLAATALAALVLLALGMTALRLAQPLVADQRAALESALSARLDRQVRIGTLGVGMSGFRPRLRLSDVRVGGGDGAEPAIALETIELEPDLIASLRARALRPAELVLAGADLTLLHGPGGRWRLHGLDALRGPGGGLEAFLQRGRLRLLRARLRFGSAPGRAPHLQLSDVALDLDNRDGSHRLRFGARLTGDANAAARLRLDADLRGLPARPDSWNGRLYGRFDGRDPAALLAPLAQTLWPGQAVLADLPELHETLLEGWLRLRSGRLEQGLTRFDLRAPPSLSGLAPARLRGLARLTAAGDGGWRVQVHDLEFPGSSKASATVPAGVRLDLTLARGARLEALDLHAPELDLAGPLAALTAWLPPDWADGSAASLSWLHAAAPHGRVTELRLRMRRAGEMAVPSSWRWSARGQLQQLGWSAVDSIPGLDGIEGRFHAGHDGGWLRLAGAGARLEASGILAAPLVLQQLAARLRWRTLANGDWHFDLSGLDFVRADLVSRLHGSLQLPAHGVPQIDLAGTFEGPVERLHDYLPVGIMGPELQQWLNDAIVSGRMERAALTLHGDPGRFPFRDGGGGWELRLDVDDLELAYAPGWPAITDAAAVLQFANTALDIALSQGRIHASRLERTKAHIPDLWDARAINVRGTVLGPFGDLRRVLTETPLAQRLGEIGSILKTSGQSRLRLDLQVPFDKGKEVAVRGRLDWPRAAGLRLTDTPLALSALNGEIAFTEDAINAERLGARLWGRAVTLGIETRAGSDSGVGGPSDAMYTRVTARARTPVAELARRWPSPFWKPLAGGLDWRLAVDLPHRGALAAAEIGWQLDSDLRGLAMTLPEPLGKSSAATRTLALAGTLRPRRAFSLQGRVGELAAALRWDLGAKVARLRAGELWLGRPGVPDLPAAGLRLAVQRLDLAPLLAAGKSESPGNEIGGVSDALLMRLPSTQLSVADLRWKQQRLGRLDAELLSSDLGLRLSRLRLAGGKLLTLSGQGEWFPDADGGHSNLVLDLDSADLGGLVTLLDEGQVLEAGAAHAHLRLDWPGNVTRFAWKTARGRATLKMGAGRFLVVEPGVGRVLGLFNISLLSRRLALDFSDLFGRGLAFDQAHGTIEIAGGKARAQRMMIESPVGRVQIAGTTDLVARRFDQTVTVGPQVGSGVAIAGAVAGTVAGGPALGAAVYLADRVAGSPIDRVGQFRYRVTGPWDNPVIERLNWKLPGSARPAADPDIGRQAVESGMLGSPPRPARANPFLRDD